MKKLTVFFLILVSRALDCYGCSCAEPPPPLEAIKRADVVFVATVVSGTLEGDYERKFEFKIKEVLKGKLKDKVSVITGLGGGDCGYDFIIGREYLVYASGRKELTTNICTRTKEYRPYGKKEVDELKSQIETPSVERP